MKIEVYEPVIKTIYRIIITIPCEKDQVCMGDLSDLPEAMTAQPNLEFSIDPDTGVIDNWHGKAVDVCFKVVDRGTYQLIDPVGKTITKLEYEYVPNCFNFDGRSYGDYLRITTDSLGRIVDFNRVCNEESIFEGFRLHTPE